MSHDMQIVTFTIITFEFWGHISHVTSGVGGIGVNSVCTSHFAIVGHQFHNTEFLVFFSFILEYSN